MSGHPGRLPYGVLVNAATLRHQMRLRGLTAAEVARRARRRKLSVSEATISHALNGHRIHPAKLRAIAAVLHDAEPLPGVDELVHSELRAGTDELQESSPSPTDPGSSRQ